MRIVLSLWFLSFLFGMNQRTIALGFSWKAFCERMKSWGSHCTLWLFGGFSGEEKLVDVTGPELLEASKNSGRKISAFTSIHKKAICEHLESLLVGIIIVLWFLTTKLHENVLSAKYYLGKKYPCLTFFCKIWLWKVTVDEYIHAEWVGWQHYLSYLVNFICDVSGPCFILFM